MKRGFTSIILVVSVVIVLIIAIGILLGYKQCMLAGTPKPGEDDSHFMQQNGQYYYCQTYWEKLRNNEPVNTQSQTAASSPTESSTPGWKSISWHDPANTILGFKFDAPDSWVEYPDSGSERQITVASCPPNTEGCIVKSFNVQVLARTYTPDTYPLPKDWIKTTITVGGVTVDKIVKPGTIALTDIDFNKDKNWYHIELANGGTPDQQKADEPIFEHILSTFAFTTAQPPQAPAEYELFKDIDAWKLTYQDSSNNNRLACADGRKGDSTKGFSFAMVSDGYGDPPGDIDAPYKKVITVLKNDGWKECGIPLSQQDPSNQGYDQVFIKNNKLIGVSRHYSNGVGNGLSVAIQYDK